MANPKSVAKITEAVRVALGADRVLDATGNIVVNLDFGDVLETTQFTAIPFVPDANAIIPPPRNRPLPKP